MKEHYDFTGGKRGAISTPDPRKTRITIRLDTDVLGWFKEKVHLAGGGNYQTLINDALRHHVFEAKEPLEDMFRRVLREELHGKLPSSEIAEPQTPYDSQ